MAIMIENTDILSKSDRLKNITNDVIASTPSERYPSVLENLVTSVNSYWKTPDFTDGELYAEVVVNKNVNDRNSIISFMDYLSEKDDTLRPAEQLGNWEIVPGLSSNVDVSTNIENPKTQPTSISVSPPIPSEIPDNERLTSLDISGLSQSVRSSSNKRPSFSSIVNTLNYGK